MCMCVHACVQKSLAFFLFFREKECWHKASHYGRSRRLECRSATPGLFHFICTVMSLVTAVSRELKVKPHKGRNAGKKGGKVNTKEANKSPNVHLKTYEHFGTRGAIKRNFFFCLCPVHCSALFPNVPPLASSSEKKLKHRSSRGLKKLAVFVHDCAYVCLLECLGGSVCVVCAPRSVWE